MKYIICFSFLSTARATDCNVGGASLCSCSELIKKKLIHSIDDCTQASAVEACKSGKCAHDVNFIAGNNDAGPKESAMNLPFNYHNEIGDFNMSWGFPSTNVIEIEFSLPSDFYIGLGFTGDGVGDTVAGWVQDGKVHVYDYWDSGNTEPVTDQSKGCKNDVEPVSGHYSDGVTTVRFRRKLATGDKEDCDAPIVKGPMDIVYAWCDGTWCFDYQSGCKAYADGCLDMPHSSDASNHVTVDFSGKGLAMLKTDLVV